MRMKMGRNWRAVGWAAGLLFCFAANEAFADIEVIDTEPSNSWITKLRLITGTTLGPWDRVVLTSFAIGQSVTFLDNSTGTVDCLFEVPGSQVISDFQQAGWTVTPSQTTGHAEATRGSLVNVVNFKIHFANPSNPGAVVGTGAFSVDLFDGGTFVGHGHQVIQRFANGTFKVGEGHITAAPVPAAVWTGLPLLAGMMLLLRRRKRRMLV
jgi:hypothetical protein